MTKFLPSMLVLILLTISGQALAEGFVGCWKVIDPVTNTEGVIEIKKHYSHVSVGSHLEVLLHTTNGRTSSKHTMTSWDDHYDDSNCSLYVSFKSGSVKYELYMLSMLVSKSDCSLQSYNVFAPKSETYLGTGLQLSAKNTETGAEYLRYVSSVYNFFPTSERPLAELEVAPCP